MSVENPVENLVVALRLMAPPDDGPSLWRNGRTAHWEGPTTACWLFHRGCAMRKAADELERLEAEVARLGAKVAVSAP